ncbi:phage tail protein I [Escherichia coli]|uniref:phage tail protein I n=1 Tax=Escherichia coli TaxID=562 RepID=UPI003013DA45
MNSLLPPGSTPLERQLAQTCSGISDLQVPLRDLWNPATCPVSFLPYLAWAFSVDRWDEGWTESVKRQVVKDAFYIHQHKGTTSAVRRVVEPFGFLIRIIEWWQAQHGAAVDAAEAQRQSLIDAAMASISLIQLKLQAGRKLTQAETTRLNAVLDYTDAVTATDTSTAPDVIWPELPEA